MKHIDVLVIDDEKKFADMLVMRLGLRGCRCKVFYDGYSGLEWIKENPAATALILLDLQLPDIYGIQVLEAIKVINPEIPVVILTGHGTDADKQHCEQIGVYAFANKPLSIEKIITILSQIQKRAEC